MQKCVEINAKDVIISVRPCPMETIDRDDESIVEDEDEDWLDLMADVKMIVLFLVPFVARHIGTMIGRRL